MNKFKYLLPIIILAFSPLLYSKAKKDYSADEKKAFLSYQAKCMKEVELPLHQAQRYCKCMSKELLDKLSAEDMQLLIKPQKQLSAEEAAKVENENPRLDSAQSFEWSIANLCNIKSKKRK